MSVALVIFRDLSKVAQPCLCVSLSLCFLSAHPALAAGSAICGIWTPVGGEGRGGAGRHSGVLLAR